MRISRELFTCTSGLTFSLQTSSFHYCTPRTDKGPWSQVEIGFPNQAIEKLMPFAEDKDRPTGTVYGWVPMNIIMEVITDNGGLIPADEARLTTVLLGPSIHIF